MKGLIFTYAATYGGALAALFYPYYGFLIYVCFAIVRPQAKWSFSVPPGNYSRVVAIGLLLGWVLQGFGSWDFRRAKPAALMLVGYWIWLCVSFMQVVSNTEAQRFLEGQTKIVLPFLVALTLIDSKEKLRQLAWVIVLSEGYLAFEFNQLYYQGTLGIPAEFYYGSLDNNGTSVGMVVGAGVAFFLGLEERGWIRKLVCFGCAALMVHVPMFLMSRGGMLGLAVLGGTSFMLLPKKLSHYFLFACAVAIALRLAGPSVMEEFGTTFAERETRDASAQSRLDLWGDCWDCMQRNPVLGAGPAQWRLIVHNYGWPAGKDAHSTWMRTGAELGFPGVLFLASFFGGSCWSLWRLTRRYASSGSDLAGYARMSLAATAGFVVAGSFVSLEGLEIAFYSVLIGLGTLRLAEERVAAGAVDLVREGQMSGYPGMLAARGG